MSLVGTAEKRESGEGVELGLLLQHSAAPSSECAGESEIMTSSEDSNPLSLLPPEEDGVAGLEPILAARGSGLRRRLNGSTVFYGYFIEGFMNHLLYSTMYPLFGNYLGMPGHQYNSTFSLFRLAWTGKCIFSFMSDSVPIRGYRRLPYLLIGYVLIGIAFSLIIVKPMPKPRFLLDNETCLQTTIVANPNSMNEGYYYLTSFFIWFLGISCFDCILDGLLMQISFQEPDKLRGRAIIITRFTSKIGMFFGLCFNIVFLNGTNYGGRFCFHIPFNYVGVTGMAFLVTLVVYSLLFTNERSLEAPPKTSSVRETKTKLLKAFQSSCVNRLVIYMTICMLSYRIRTPAGIKVMNRWIKVEPMTNNIAAFISIFIDSFGIMLFLKYVKHINWRVILATQMIVGIVLEVPVVYLTVFDVIRNQYFWFADDFIDAVFHHWFFLVINILLVEYTDKGLEAAFYACFFSIIALCGVAGSALSNIVMAPFHVVDDAPFLRDSDADQTNVFLSYCVGWLARLVPIFALFLIPKQKKQAREWKSASVAQPRLFAFLYILIGLGASIGLGLNVLTMLSSTRCLAIAGGAGCESDDITAEESLTLNASTTMYPL